MANADSGSSHSEQHRRIAGVDVGGTFTDVVVIGDTEAPRALKVPTTADDQGHGVQQGIRAACAPGAAPAVIAHGTTTATNAVLERAVARTALVTTEGFADVLVIARQDRPSLYDLRAVRPEPLVPRERVITAAERTAPDGRALVALTEDEIARVADAVADAAPESVAVSLLFSYAGPEHEERLCAALERRLGVPVTRSSALLPEFREYERASTCVLNAAVAPIMVRYLSGLRQRLPEAAIAVMTSAGGIAGIDAMARDPVHTLLSGPAAGVVAAGAVAGSAGFPDAVAFDMGGTSTDVCLIRGGRPDIAAEAEIAGLPFRTPAVAVHTVGAGGGSVAWIDRGGALRVGPRSAGARPGPVCYGQGGTEPTVTDAHCALGHLGHDRTFGEGALRLDAAAARAAVDRLGAAAGGAEGILQVVRATMARALRRVTTERGVDPSELALVAYGGAGPLHAAALGRDLGCAAVIVPPAPGVLSALGLLLASGRHEASRTVATAADADLDEFWADLERAAAEALRRQGAGADVTLSRAADCRYLGQSHELRIAAPAGADLAAGLHEAHQAAYGYATPGEPVEVVTLRVTAQSPPALQQPPRRWDLGSARPRRQRAVTANGREQSIAVIDRAALRPDDRVEGPLIIEQPDSTTLLAPGDAGLVDDAGNLVVRWDD